MNLLPSALTLSAALLVISAEGSTTRRKLHQFLNLRMDENEQAVLKCKSAAVHDHPNRILSMARKDTNAVDKPINIRANVVLITGSDKSSNNSAETIDGIKVPSTVKIQIVSRNGTHRLHDLHNKASQQPKILKQTADNYLNDYDYRDDDDNDFSQNSERTESANGKLKAKSAAGATKTRYAEAAMKNFKKKLVDKSSDRSGLAMKRKGTNIDHLASEQNQLMAAKLTVRPGKEFSKQGDKSDDNYYIKKFQSLNHPPKKPDEKTIESEFFDKALPRIIADAKPDNDSINNSNTIDNNNINISNNKNHKNSNSINNSTNNNSGKIRKPFHRAPLTKPVEVVDRIRLSESEMVKRNAELPVTAVAKMLTSNAAKKWLSNATKLRRSVERNITNNDNRKRPVLKTDEKAESFVNETNSEPNGNYNRENVGKDVTWKAAQSNGSNTNGKSAESSKQTKVKVSTAISEKKSKTQLKSIDAKSPEYNSQPHSLINSTDKLFKEPKMEDDTDRKATANRVKQSRPPKGKRESGKWKTSLSHDKNVLLLGKDQTYAEKNKPRHDGRRNEISNDRNNHANKFKSASGSNEKIVFPSLDRHLFAAKKKSAVIAKRKLMTAVADKRSGVAGYKRSIGTEGKPMSGQSYATAVNVDNRNRLNADRTNSISPKSQTKSYRKKDDDKADTKNAVRPLTNVTGSDAATNLLSVPDGRPNATTTSALRRNSTESSSTDVNSRRQSRNVIGPKNSAGKGKQPSHSTTKSVNSTRQQNTSAIMTGVSSGKVDRNSSSNRHDDKNRNDNGHAGNGNYGSRNGNESNNGTHSISNLNDHPVELRKGGTLSKSNLAIENDIEPSEVNDQPTECNQCVVKSVAPFQPIAYRIPPNNRNRLLDEHSDTLTALLFRKQRLSEKITNKRPSTPDHKPSDETVQSNSPPLNESNQTDSVLIIVIKINSTDPIPLYDILRNMNSTENDTDNENKSTRLLIGKNAVSVNRSDDDESHLPAPMAKQPKIILKRSIGKSEISGKSQPGNLAASELFTQKTIQLLQVIYNRKNAVFMGNALAPADVQFQPYVNWTAHPNYYYTLVMFDPDFPSKKNPKLKEWQNWLLVNIPSNNIKRGETLTEYIGAFLTPNTGSNRYVFMVFQQPHKLLFNEPHLTNKTITGRTHFSIRKFAMKYSLGIPVALNYFHSQWDNSIPNIYSKFLEQV